MWTQNQKYAHITYEPTARDMLIASMGPTSKISVLISTRWYH